MMLIYWGIIQNNAFFMSYSFAIKTGPQFKTISQFYTPNWRTGVYYFAHLSWSVHRKAFSIDNWRTLQSSNLKGCWSWPGDIPYWYWDQRLRWSLSIPYTASQTFNVKSLISCQFGSCIFYSIFHVFFTTFCLWGHNVWQTSLFCS